MFFLTFLGMSRAIRMVFQSNLDEPLPEMLSKTSKRRETSLKKSKKRQAIASVRSEALGGSWELMGTLGAPGGVLEGLGRSPGSSGRLPIYTKLPINRTAAVMLLVLVQSTCSFR